jgi:hypothetical protein
MAMLAETYMITLYMNKYDPILICSNSRKPFLKRKKRKRRINSLLNKEKRKPKGWLNAVLFHWQLSKQISRINKNTLSCKTGATST